MPYLYLAISLTFAVSEQEVESDWFSINFIQENAEKILDFDKNTMKII